MTVEWSLAILNLALLGLMISHLYLSSQISPKAVSA